MDPVTLAKKVDGKVIPNFIRRHPSNPASHDWYSHLPGHSGSIGLCPIVTFFRVWHRGNGGGGVSSGNRNTWKISFVGKSIMWMDATVTVVWTISLFDSSILSIVSLPPSDYLHGRSRALGAAAFSWLPNLLSRIICTGWRVISSYRSTGDSISVGHSFQPSSRWNCGPEI